MDSHLLLELAYMFYRVCASIIHDECGLMETLGKLCLFYPRVKGDLEIWLRAFFITLVPTPLPDGLLRLLLWGFSSSQEKDALGVVLDRCL